MLAVSFIHKAISISLSRFGDNRRCDLADFKRRFPASQKILICTVWFICIFFISEWKRSVVHTWICLTKKNSSISSVYIFDGLYYRQGVGARANSKVGNRLSSSLVSVFKILNVGLACSRRSDSRAREKNSRRKKNEGD